MSQAVAIMASIALLVSLVAIVVLQRRTREATRPLAVPTPDVAAAIAEIGEARARVQGEAAAMVRNAEVDAAGLRRSAERDAESIRRQAEVAASNAALDARRLLDDELRVLADESHTLRLDLERREQRISERESRLDEQARHLDDQGRHLEEETRRVQARELDLAAQETQLRALRAELQDVEAERRLILERVAGLTAADAKAELVNGIENQAKREAAILVRDIEAEAKDDGEERARKHRQPRDPTRGERADRRVRRLGASTCPATT